MTQRQVARMSTEQVLQFWPAIERRMRLSPISSEAGFSPEEILSGILGRFETMWALVRADAWAEGFLTTRLEDAPRGRTLVITGMWADELADWLPMLMRELPLVAQSAGARFCEVLGRPGWARLPRPYGFELERIVMFREFAPRTLN